ncbi:hypothetical protein BD626DRAFT_398778, partial [Schizophyllum amplum]
MTFHWDPVTFSAKDFQCYRVEDTYISKPKHQPCLTPSCVSSDGPSEYPLDLASPMQFSYAVPYAALTPTHVSHPDNPILWLISLPDVKIVETISHGWHLDKPLMEAWIDLELRLIAIRKILIQHATHPNLPVSYTSWVLPCFYGYRRGHESCNIAWKCAARSRDALAIFMAECRFLVMSNAAVTDSRGRIDVGVLHDLLSSAGQPFHYAWLNALVDAWRVPCAGVFVDPRHCVMTVYVLQMVHTGVPVYFVWGTLEDIKKLRMPGRQCPYSDFIPSDANVGGAHIHLEPSAELRSPSATPSQQAGETYNGFMRRRR